MILSRGSFLPPVGNLLLAHVPSLLTFSPFVDSSESSSWGCYGDLQTLYAPGASCGTGRRRGLKYCGIDHLTVHLAPLLFVLFLSEVGLKCCMDPAVIAGVLSRSLVVEAASTSASLLAGPWPSCPTSWISKAQVSQMTEVLTVRIKEIQRRFPTWTPDQHLRALYNPRVGGLCDYTRSSQDLSCEFCNGVLARAKYFKRQGF
uniref:Lysozyme g1 n=1 Tax=Monodon monoceros TaxID=40151 RepID=A0A8C6CDE8_MONMO